MYCTIFASCGSRLGAANPLSSVASDGLRSGQPVAALGFTGGLGISLRFGHVLALHLLGTGHVIETDTAFTSGASGGGLFDDTGALVGLLTFRLAGSGGNYYSLPAEWIGGHLPTEDQWADLRPLRGPRPFWQSDAESLPYFLRVAALDAEGRWGAVLDLADLWSTVSPRDAEPLLVRGKTLQKLNRPGAAVVAFNAALRLTPDEPSAWYGLAFAYAALGDEAAVAGRPGEARGAGRGPGRRTSKPGLDDRKTPSNSRCCSGVCSPTLSVASRDRAGVNHD